MEGGLGGIPWGFVGSDSRHENPRAPFTNTQNGGKQQRYEQSLLLSKGARPKASDPGTLGVDGPVAYVWVTTRVWYLKEKNKH